MQKVIKSFVLNESEVAKFKKSTGFDIQIVVHTIRGQSEGLRVAVAYTDGQTDDYNVWLFAKHTGINENKFH
jgi:hypothetical protein